MSDSRFVLNVRDRDDEGHADRHPPIEVLERGSLNVAAVVFGDTEEQVLARAEMVQIALDKDLASRRVRRELRWLTWYKWAYFRAKRNPIGLGALVFALLSIEIEPTQTGRWLKVNFPDPRLTIPRDRMEAYL